MDFISYPTLIVAMENRGLDIGITLSFALPLLLGMVHCFRIARRPRTNTKACVALGLLLTAWFMSMLLHQLKKSMGEEGLIYQLVQAGYAMMFLVLLITALVLAILALVELSKHRADYDQGKKQAVWSLVICGFFVLLVGIGFVIGIAKAIQRSQGARATAPVVDQVQEFEELNYRYTSPGSGWAPIDPVALDPDTDATVAAMRRNPETYLMIIAERNDQHDTPSMTRFAKAYMTAGNPDAKVSNEQPQVVKGMNGHRFDTDVTIDGLRLSYVHWIHTHNGFAYQLLMWTDAKNRARLNASVARVLAGFEILDPSRVYNGDLNEPYGSYASEVFGYRIELDARWRAWEALPEDIPGAETGALIRTGRGFNITPFWFGDMKPNDGALMRSLLRAEGVDYPNDSFVLKAREDLDGLAVTRFYTEDKDDDGTIYNHHALLRGEDYALLITAWDSDRDEQLEALLDEVLDSFEPGPVRLGKERASGLEGPRAVSQAKRLNSAGMHYLNDAKNNRRAAEFFHEAATWANADHHHYLTNLLEAYNNDGRHEDAIAAVAQFGEAHREEPAVQSWHAWHLSEDGQNEAALEIYTRLFDGDYRAHEDFNTYLGLLGQAGRWDEAHAKARAYLKSKEAREVRKGWADVLYEHKRHAEAIAIIDEAPDQGVFDPEYAYERIYNMLETEQLKEALALCDRIEEQSEPSGNSWYQRGRILYRLKWYRKAKDAFEKALELSPSSEGAKDFIQHLSGLLGEGDNTGVRKNIEAVALPSAVQRRMPALAEKPDMTGHGSGYGYRINVIAYRKGEDYRESAYRRIHVENASGVTRYSTISVDYNPLYEQVYVNRLAVLNQQGKVLSEGRRADFYIIDDTDSGMATHEKTLHMPVPSLEPGHVIELVYTREKLNNASFVFDSSFEAVSQPVVLQARVFVGATNEVRWLVLNDLKTERLPEGLAWIQEKPRPYVSEPRQDFAEHFLPAVYLCDRNASWTTETTNYLAEIKDRLVLEEPVRAWARRFAGDAASTEEKVHRLARFVQTNLTYKAIEFGTRGTIPNRPAKTLSNRYGDCKDHAVLLDQLLDAVGVKSHLALVNNNDLVMDELPSLDQFNHVINYLPDLKGGLYIDTTDKDIDPVRFVPSGLAGSRTCLMDPAAPRLHRVPGYRAETNTSHSESEIRIEDADLVVEDRTTLQGHLAAFLRYQLNRRKPASHPAWAQSMISRYVPGAILEHFETTPPRDTTRPLVVTMKFRVVDAVDEDGDRRAFRRPCVWERYHCEEKRVPERRNPFDVHYPFTCSSKSRVHVPQGFTMQPESAVPSGAGAGPFGSWRSSSSAPVVEFNYQLKKGRHPAERFGDFVDFSHQALRAAESRVRLRRSAQ